MSPLTTLAATLAVLPKAEATPLATELAAMPPLIISFVAWRAFFLNSFESALASLAGWLLNCLTTFGMVGKMLPDLRVLVPRH